MADWTENAIERLRKEAVLRLTRVCIATVNDLKVVVSVPAPRRIAASGRVYAATKATPGAPPRKLTGRGRASLSYRVDPISLTGIVGTNVVYMGVHERHDHKFVAPTLAANRTMYERILGG